MGPFFKGGGITYICGGARNFGAAVVAEVVDIIKKHGNMSVEDASAYLRNTIAEGQFQEELWSNNNKMRKIDTRAMWPKPLLFPPFPTSRMDVKSWSDKVLW